MPDAIAALEKAGTGSVRVLGLEGFVEPLRPTLEYIADFARIPDAAEAVARAVETLKSWPDSLLVEIVTDEPDAA